MGAAFQLTAVMEGSMGVLLFETAGYAMVKLHESSYIILHSKRSDISREQVGKISFGQGQF